MTNNAALGDELVEFIPNRHRFGFNGRNAAYRAALLGEFPVIKLAGKWFVPIKAVEAMYEELGRQAAQRVVNRA